MTKTIYHFDSNTGEYIADGLSDISPLEPDVFLIPQFATDIAPPKYDQKTQIAVFKDRSWNIQNLPIPDAIDLLAQAKQAQINKINNACAMLITGSFQSTALGKEYRYPSQQSDQANLTANVLSSIYPNLPPTWTTQQLCCDANGKWAYLPHSAAQIQKVGLDAKQHIMSCLGKKSNLQAQIEVAKDIATVQSINW